MTTPFLKAAGLLLAALLTACAGPTGIDTMAASESGPTVAEPPQAEIAGDKGLADEAGELATKPPEPEEAPIPEDSLYPLMTAEFALRAREFDYALMLLAKEALKLEDPEVARRALQVAEFRNRNDVALQMAIRLTELDPEDAAAANMAMTLLIRLGRPDQAVIFAREAKRRGSRINAPALLGNLEQFDENTQRQVAGAIMAMAKEWPEDLDLAVAKALVQRQTGNLDGSVATLTDALNTNPDDDRVLVLITRVLIERGDSNPWSTIEDAVARAPDNEPLRLQYARLLAGNQRIDDARAQFLMLQELAPRNGDYFYALALVELEAGNTAAARDNLETLVELGQRTDEAWYYLGRTAEQEIDIDGAIAAYRKVGPSREFFDARRRAGELLLDDGNREAFVDLFNRSRQQNPGQAERIYLLQADLLRGRERWADAVEVYTDALGTFAESMSLQYGRAMTYEQLGEIGEMERDLRAILDREPDNSTTLNALGYTLTVHTERYEEAASLIERALELSPGEAAILDSLGWVYFKLGRFEDALPPLVEAYKLLPDPEVASHLGETLWTMGRAEDAQAIWRDALNRDPGNRLVTQTLQRLGVPID